MIGDGIKARFEAALDRRFGALGIHLDHRVDQLEKALAEERERRIDAERGLHESIDALDRSVNIEQREILRAIAAEEPRNRRRLFELREDPDYELPFTENEPLVSICITAIPERLNSLLERTLPSALGQTYANVEVIVVGNRCGDAHVGAIEHLNDARVRFTDLTHRVVHTDPTREWLKAATMSRNEAHRQAGGMWIADLDDDDALKLDAIEGLLELAQSQKLEVAYGYHEEHVPSGESKLVGGFPPQLTDPKWRENQLPWAPWQGFASNGAIWHTGMKIFAREHVAAELHTPGDYFRLERMVRAGVRFGMLDRAVYEYWPSSLWDA
jgi:hypothetical protein